MVKYPFWVHKLLHYTIQHENGRHIDFRQKSVSPGQIQLTTARRFSAYMSSRALATTTTSSLHYVDILLTHTRMDGWMDGWMDCTSKAEKSIINFIIKTRLYMQMLRQLTYARKIRLIRCFIVIVKRGANKINCSGRCPLKDAHRQQCTVNDERHGLTKRGWGDRLSVTQERSYWLRGLDSCYVFLLQILRMHYRLLVPPSRLPSRILRPFFQISHIY